MHENDDNTTAPTDGAAASDTNVPAPWQKGGPSPNKAGRPEICKVMGMSGKPVGMHGSEVACYCLEGRIKEVAEYCETDIVNTYRVWLRHELFRGRLTDVGYAASETNLIEYIRLRSNTKPHLIDLMS
jgi:3'-5' exonuclease